MLAIERQNTITRLINEKGAVTVGEILNLFDVSAETVRRDLLLLEKRGKLRRIHGGAISMGETVHYKDYAQRATEHTKAKQQIARLAAEYVNEGDYIAIDSGTTAVSFCRAILGKFKKLTVITYCMKVFDILKEDKNIDIILSGGTYSKQNMAFLGKNACDGLKKYHAAKCFICPDAVSLKYGLSVQVEEIVPLEQALMDISDKTVVLADSGKFEQCALYTLDCALEGALVITDNGLLPVLEGAYGEKGIQVAAGK